MRIKLIKLWLWWFRFSSSKLKRVHCEEFWWISPDVAQLPISSWKDFHRDITTCTSVFLAIRSLETKSTPATRFDVKDTDAYIFIKSIKFKTARQCTTKNIFVMCILLLYKLQEYCKIKSPKNKSIIKSILFLYL